MHAGVGHPRDPWSEPEVTGAGNGRGEGLPADSAQEGSPSGARCGPAVLASLGCRDNSKFQGAATRELAVQVGIRTIAALVRDIENATPWVGDEGSKATRRGRDTVSRGLGFQGDHDEVKE
jgi:hypothetical protein